MRPPCEQKADLSGKKCETRQPLVAISSTLLKSGLPVCVHATVHLPASVHVLVRCETRGLRGVHLGGVRGSLQLNEGGLQDNRTRHLSLGPNSGRVPQKEAHSHTPAAET